MGAEVTPPKEIEPAKEVNPPKETIPPEYGLYRDPHAFEFAIVKDSGGEKDPGAVPIVKMGERPPYRVLMYRSDDDTYAAEPSPTTEDSCLGRDLVTRMNTTVEIPSNGDDTRYKFVCVSIDR